MISVCRIFQFHQAMSEPSSVAQTACWKSVCFSGQAVNAIHSVIHYSFIHFSFNHSFIHHSFNRSFIHVIHPIIHQNCIFARPHSWHDSLVNFQQMQPGQIKCNHLYLKPLQALKCLTWHNLICKWSWQAWMPFRLQSFHHFRWNFAWFLTRLPSIQGVLRCNKGPLVPTVGMDSLQKQASSHCWQNFC